jgi:hypothetical protein
MPGFGTGIGGFDAVFWVPGAPVSLFSPSIRRFRGFGIQGSRGRVGPGRWGCLGGPGQRRRRRQPPSRRCGAISAITRSRPL